MNTDNLNELRALLEGALALVNDPQPGEFSWRRRLHGTLLEISQAAGRAPNRAPGTYCQTCGAVAGEDHPSGCKTRITRVNVEGKWLRQCQVCRGGQALLRVETALRARLGRKEA